MRIFHYLIVAYATILPLAMELIRYCPPGNRYVQKYSFQDFSEHFKHLTAKKTAAA
jgi:hypothetical protein